MKKTNDRIRHYGLKVGDIVEERAFGVTLRGKVISLPAGDNNAAYICLEDGEKMEVVAEWCTIVEKAREVTYLRFRKTNTGYNVTVRGVLVGTIIDKRVDKTTAAGGSWDVNVSGLERNFSRLCYACDEIRAHLHNLENSK
jgi:hypothetical protein